MIFFQNAKSTDLRNSSHQITSVDEHVCRVMNNPQAMHVVDNHSGRFSVLIPFQRNDSTLSEASDSTSYQETFVDLSFGCLNTCMGTEYSLRLWSLVITLETE